VPHSWQQPGGRRVLPDSHSLSEHPAGTTRRLGGRSARLYYDLMRLSRGPAAAVVASIALLHVHPALATDKLACVSQAEEGQRLRKERKLVAAHDRFLACSTADCPEIVTADCTRWLGEVERGLASVIVKAEDARRQPLTDVRVLLDGSLLTERPTSTPILVDPGVHVVRYERDESPPLEEHIELSEGERGRVLYAQFPDVAAASQTPPQPNGARPVRESAPAPADPAEASQSEPGLPTSFWVLGGLAVVGASSFAAFGLWGQNDEANLMHECAPYCSQSQVAPPRTKYIIADVSLAIAILAAGGALWVAIANQNSTAHVQAGTQHLSFDPTGLRW
jgi:hypothetical protein